MCTSHDHTSSYWLFDKAVAQSNAGHSSQPEATVDSVMEQKGTTASNLMLHL